jgi:Aminoglycoside-2''-adenylyltransferase
MRDEPTGSLDHDSWDPWSPSEVARHLERLTTPWYVTAGWALDLFLGRQTREHEDIEIGVPSHTFPAIRSALAGFELVVVGGGRSWPVTKAALAAHHQTWVRDPATGRWRLDIFRDPWDGDSWTFRRDPRIRLPSTSLVSRTSDGIPFAKPEVVLLFKASDARPKDESDFEAVVPHLGEHQRMWLREALALAYPGHRWLVPLQAG